MTPIQVTLNISKPEKDVLDLLAKVVADLKAQKPIASITQDLEAGFITVIGEAGSLPSDFAASDKYDLGIYLVEAIKTALV